MLVRRLSQCLVVPSLSLARVHLQALLDNATNPAQRIIAIDMGDSASLVWNCELLTSQATEHGRYECKALPFVNKSECTAACALCNKHLHILECRELSRSRVTQDVFTSTQLISAGQLCSQTPCLPRSFLLQDYRGTSHRRAAQAHAAGAALALQRRIRPRPVALCGDGRPKESAAPPAAPNLKRDSRKGVSAAPRPGKRLIFVFRCSPHSRWAHAQIAQDTRAFCFLVATVFLFGAPAHHCPSHVLSMTHDVFLLNRYTRSSPSRPCSNTLLAAAGGTTMRALRASSSRAWHTPGSRRACGTGGCLLCMLSCIASTSMAEQSSESMNCLY